MVSDVPINLVSTCGGIENDRPDHLIGFVGHGVDRKGEYKGSGCCQVGTDEKNHESEGLHQ